MADHENANIGAAVSKHLNAFYEQRLQIIRGLDLRKILSNKNPYLLKMIGLETPREIITYMLHAFLSASDETIAGNKLGLLAKDSARGNVGGGYGFDFTIIRDNKLSAYSMKSGTKWGNSSQKGKADSDFVDWSRRVREEGNALDPVIGHVYGIQKNKKTKSKKGSKRFYRDVSGQAFWTEITGDADYYLKLTRHMKQKETHGHKQEYEKALHEIITKFTDDFTADFCNPDGSVDWDKLTRYVSEENRELRKQIQKKYRKPSRRKSKASVNAT